MILRKKADINLPKLKSELFGIFDSLAYEYYIGMRRRKENIIIL